MIVAKGKKTLDFNLKTDPPERDELMRRIRKRALKENRLDDASDEVIEHRMSQYEEETKQLLDYYSSPHQLNIPFQGALIEHV